MRYLSAFSSGTIAGQIDQCVGHGRIRALATGEDPNALGGERFAAILTDDAARLPLSRHDLPVVLLVSFDRAGLRQFRVLAESAVDVRLWTDCGATLSETTLRCLSSARAPSPAAAIVHHLRGSLGSVAADIISAAAILASGRRSMDEIARVCDSSASGVRNALRDENLITISGILARMRALHALWAWEAGRTNFWTAAGFKGLAELSAHLSQYTGAPLGRWKVPGGFNALLQSVGQAVRETGEGREAAAG